MRGVVLERAAVGWGLRCVGYRACGCAQLGRGFGAGKAPGWLLSRGGSQPARKMQSHGFNAGRRQRGSVRCLHGHRPGASALGMCQVVELMAKKKEQLEETVGFVGVVSGWDSLQAAGDAKCQ